VFGGTSDLMLPDVDPATSAYRKIANPEQFIFALNLGVNPTMLSGAPARLTTRELTGLTYMRDTLFPSYGLDEDQATVSAGAYGWYLKLRPKISHSTEPTEPEYVTTSPFLYQGVLYVSTFIPRTRQPYSDEKCEGLGDGKLYAFDPLTGKPMWKNGQALVFNDIKISGVSASVGKMFLGVKVLRNDALARLKQQTVELKDFKIHADGQYLSFGALGEPGGGVPDVVYDVPHMEYWKETF
jgi:hypothetical protein